MKYIFLSMLVAVSTSSFAQSWEVGVNGGVGHNSLPYVNGEQPQNVTDVWLQQNTSPGSPSATTAMGRILCARNSKNDKWQVGISADALTLSYTYIQSYDYQPSVKNKVTFGAPAVPVQLFFNRKIHLGNVELYGGLMGGYVYGRRTDRFIDPYQQELHTSQKDCSGYTVGADIGVNYFFTQHIGVNVAATYNYLFYNSGSNNYSLFVYTASAGLLYRFAHKDHKSEQPETTN